jgi:uncharacterized RDD family membrane protein YckC
MTLPAANSEVYAGFWIRVWAFIVDSLLWAAVAVPVLLFVYGWDYMLKDNSARPVDLLLTWALPALATVLFWIRRQATPGKMAISARVVDATTGHPPSTRQLVGRYVGYFISGFPLFLGFLWVAWDRRKQGWHDKIANTVVIRDE